MTPLQFARQECANYRDGKCSGIGIRDDLTLYIFGAKPVCAVAEGQRCRYFEECVLPMGIEPNNAKNAIRLKEKDEAVNLYWTTAPKISRKLGRICPHCGKTELEPRERMCYACKGSARRKSYSKYNPKRQSLSTTVKG